MTKRPWYHTNAADYIAETALLSAEAHGVYRMLIDYLWMYDNKLPNDFNELGRIVRVDCEELKRIFNAELRSFFIMKDGEISNEKISDELFKINKNTELRERANEFDIPSDINPELWQKWMAIRLRKGAINSEAALKALVTRLNTINAAGRHTRNEAITIAVQESWKSVRIDWLDNLDGVGGQNGNFSKPKTGADVMADELTRFLKRNST